MCHKITVVSERKAAFAASACLRSSRGTECESLLRWENWDPCAEEGWACCAASKARCASRRPAGTAWGTASMATS